mgnify:CR=1 FL=1
MSAILTEIISLLVGGINGIAEGIGSGLSSLVTNIFIDKAAEGGALKLTMFGGLVAVFGGIGLAVGLSRLVVRWVSSLGGSRI